MKYIEVPDFHVDPDWIETSEQAAEAIRLTAIKENAQFIALAGDFFNRPLYASNRSKYDRVLNIVRSWIDVCPVVAIEGTPSHDGPGCYGPLEELGVTLLQPGKVYCAYSHDKRIYDIIKDKSPKYITSLIFGIPEIKKENLSIISDAESNNAKITSLITDYVNQFIAPHRAKYPDIPAICLYHGNVSDSHRSNETDVILKASDIVLHTEDLAPANITRWTFGHIHTPWESSVVWGGYAGFTGMDGNPWGKTGFIPAANLIDLDTKKVKRIEYGTPQKIKVDSVSKITTKKNIAWWVETNDESETLPEGLHHWSRITYKKTEIETRRISEDEAKDIKTLKDLFIAIDPEVTKNVLSKVDMITSEIKPQQYDKKDIRLEYLRVTGSTFFRDAQGVDTIELNTTSLKSGLTAIMADNGGGKSSLLSFCSPYPVVIGKDTDSGRMSAIKDFFYHKESIIEKRFIVNDQYHKHIITIKGAHTKSPKTECFLLIDDVNQMTTTSWDEMFALCEKLYGSYTDFLMTYFYVQPQQGKTQSSLMNASMTEIRNLVQNIAGIDRESEKRYALDKKDELSKDIEKDKSWLSAAEEFIKDPEAVKSEIDLKNNLLITAEKTFDENKKQGLRQKSFLENLMRKKKLNDEQKNIKIQNDRKIQEFNQTIEDNKNKIEEAKSLVNNLEKYKKQIDDNNNALQLKIDVEKKINDHERLINEVRNKYQEAEANWKDYILKVKTFEMEIQAIKSEIIRIKKPCIKCGFIDEHTTEKIEKLMQEKEDKKNELSSIKPVNKPNEDDYSIPKYTGPNPTKIKTLSDFEISTLKELISESEFAAIKIKSAQEIIDNSQKELRICLSNVFDIDTDLDGKILKETEILQQIRDDYIKLQSHIKTISDQITTLEKELSDIKAQHEKIINVQSVLINKESDLDDWSYIAKMLNADKIPALELEIIVDTIDAEATRIIEPYRESRYTFRTETQRAGKKKMTDKFDIMIHDAKTGMSKSFLKHSPGEKAFFNDAYTKALIRQRRERSGLIYAPVIMDESDGAIQPGKISDYYEIQNNYFDCPVLVVSHSPEAHNYIQNHIDIKNVCK